MLVFIFFRQDRTYRILGWCIAIREAEKTISTSSVLWWSVCSFADSDGCILLTANAEMLNMVYKMNYSSACSCRLLSITFFFAETDRHPVRKRKTCIYTDTMQSRNTTVKNLSFIKRAEQTNSSTTICSHTLTKISFAFLSLFSFAFTLLSHFTFSILEPSVLRSPHFAFQHRTTKSPQYISIYSPLALSLSLALKWSTSAHILVVEWKNHFFFFFFFSSSSPFFVSSDLRPSLPVSYLNLKRIED